MDAVLKSLEVLWQGMLAIFIVMGVVFLFVFLMNQIDSRSKKRDQDK